VLKKDRDTQNKYENLYGKDLVKAVADKNGMISSNVGFILMFGIVEDKRQKNTTSKIESQKEDMSRNGKRAFFIPERD